MAKSVEEAILWRVVTWLKRARIAEMRPLFELSFVFFLCVQFLTTFLQYTLYVDQHARCKSSVSSLVSKTGKKPETGLDWTK